MATKIECYGCGGDCSHAYATHYGYPYHFGCLPIRKPRDALATLIVSLPITGAEDG